MDNHIVCFDIGGTAVKYGIFNEADDKLVEQGKFDTRLDDGDAVLGEMQEVIEDYQKRYHVTGVSFSSPGFIDTKNGVILSGNIINGFNGLNLAETFQTRCHVPVAVENDANCAAAAEYLLGNGRGSHNLACVTLGTGVGGGLVLDGKIHSGSHAMGGEFGFMFINGLHSEKPEEDIFSNDCSTRALQEKASEVVGRDIKGPEIFEKAEQGDPVLGEVLDKYYMALAMGIYNICYLVDPDTVLIGGAVSQQPALIDNVKKKLSELTPSFSVDLNDLIKLDRCLYLNDAGLVGSYCSFKNKYDREK
ncbi:MAG: ROK family protein [Eubacteriaceae bacterium]